MSTESNSSTALVLPATLVGVNRGARHHIAALGELAAELPGAQSVIRLVDSMPGRAEAGASQVEAQGGKAFPVQARFEEYLPMLAESQEPLIMALDSLKTTALALQAEETRHRWVFPYFLLRPPLEDMVSVHGALAPGEMAWRETTAKLLTPLSEFSAERGASFVIGEHARSAHRAAEPRHRAGMARHLKASLQKIVAGRMPEAAPLTLSVNGIRDMPLLVLSPPSWQDPFALGKEALAMVPVAMPRGSEFAVAEIVEGVRFHTFRLRTDGQLMVRGRHALDVAALQKAEELVKAEREAEEQRLARRTINRTNAVDITD